MANRLVGNVYIIDSALNNVSLPWPNTATVSGIAFWSTNTTGLAVFTGADTTNVIKVLSNPNNAPATVGIILNRVQFSEMKIPTLTAGTAWIYFS